MILPIVVYVAALVLLIACWVVGDVELRTKVILAVVYLGTWVFALISDWITFGAQALLVVILWYMTFGPTGRR